PRPGSSTLRAGAAGSGNPVGDPAPRSPERSTRPAASPQSSRPWRAPLARLAARTAAGPGGGPGRRAPPSSGVPRRHARRPDRWNRQKHCESRPLTLAGTLRPNAASMKLHDVADEREAQAQSPVGPRGGRVLLAEGLEDEGHRLRTDPLAGVLDEDH